MHGNPKLSLGEIRDGFHRELATSVLHIRGHRNVRGTEVPVYNNADKDNDQSVDLAARIAAMMPVASAEAQRGTKAGTAFERAVRRFIDEGNAALMGVCPWQLRSSADKPISRFSQYAHLDEVQAAIKANPELESVVGGDYLVKPDIVVWRDPIDPHAVNRAAGTDLFGENFVSRSPAIKKADSSTHHPILHASVSCKWSIRSDRSQNTRTEALNLVRNRKGRTPHIVAVTMEPMPSRIASIAIGTGDIDCVYHAALDELVVAVESGAEEHGSSWVRAQKRLATMISSRRLRDIGDLPLDLLT